MTSFTPVASGTEASVPVASTTGSDPNTVAALQSLANAMASLSQASQAQAAPQAAPTPTIAPVVTVPAAAAVPAPTSAGFRTHGPWIAASSPHRGSPSTTARTFLTGTALPKANMSVSPLSNALALAAVVGVSGSQMKAYKTQVLALEAFNEMLDYRLVSVVP
ncbi:hypothetical protein B0H14DRAFT_2576383 [Mycena olivaceomarginata]|nr:hypothetical protein B0H14DRAFT_2576383 [Mycena olivaceomarginata]